jgi:hypothetical protein
MYIPVGVQQYILSSMGLSIHVYPSGSTAMHPLFHGTFHTCIS